MQKAGDTEAIVAPPPMFAPMKLRGITIPTRMVLLQRTSAEMSSPGDNREGRPEVVQVPPGNVALVLTELTAVPAEGRIPPASPPISTPEHHSPRTRLSSPVHI